jgi:hypothetical protein
MTLIVLTVVVIALLVAALATFIFFDRCATQPHRRQSR